MGTLKEIVNTNPKLIRKLVEERRFEEDPLVILDVGAREGFEAYWGVYGDQAHLIGFEPDQEECERLQSVDTAPNHSYFPVALGRQKETRQFFRTRYPAASGLFAPDQSFWSRFPDRRYLEVVGQGKQDLVDWDSFSKTNNLPAIDFVKVDVEGAELDVLQGAQRELSESIWGISIEVEFMEAHAGQPVFSDIDADLRSRGFVLFDLLLRRHARSALSPFEDGDHSQFTSYGQLIWGQALYLRDAVEEMRNPGPNSINWSPNRLLKIASVFELFKLYDCAAELFVELEDRGTISSDRRVEYCDLLVPEAGVPFSDYAGILRQRYESAQRQRLEVKKRKNRKSRLRGLIPAPLLPRARRIRDKIRG